MTITTTDGLVIIARDARHAVEQMRDTQWNATDTKREYMAQVGERVFNMTGQQIRLSSPRAMLDDLQAVGLLTIRDDALPA